MRVVIGREGLLSGPAGRRLAGRRPDWSLTEASGEDWAVAARAADVLVPVMSPVTAEILEGGSVRLVQQFGAGVDTVDLDACRERGVRVANVPSTQSAGADAVAEVVVLLVLALARDLDGNRAAVGGTPAPPAHAVAGRRMVLVGLGAIGVAAAARLAPLGVRLVGVRARPERGAPPGVEAAYGPDDLDRLLAAADGVICCAPPSRAGPLFTAERFRAMRAGSLFVNVARGAVVDEGALLRALDDGTVAGAGLDVLAHEPASPDDPLVRHPRTIVLPHVSGTTVETLVAIADAIVDNVTRHERGEQLRWLVT